MKSMWQLLRQPMKTLSGIILIALAVAILCVCVGQAAVAANMQANLDEVCTSVALSNISYETNENGIVTGLMLRRTEEELRWIYDTAEAYPDIVERIHTPGLASAYIPELTADNHTGSFQEMFEHDVLEGMSADTSHTNYSQVMLEITLTEIGTEFASYTEDACHNALDGVSVELTGTVESVLGLQEGYADPTGFTARMTLVLPNEEALESLELEVGQRYLVYGMDYTDLDWKLRNMIAVDGYGLKASSAELDLGLKYPEIEKFYPENLKSYGGYYVYEYKQSLDQGIDRTRGISLRKEDLTMFRTVEFTLLDLSAMGIGVEDTYAAPTIVKLEGNAQEFLASDSGALWQEYLDYIGINNRSFAVIGVDDLMATGDFAMQNTTISAGRKFSNKELSSGAKVCIISEEVAALSGLEVGDTITVNYYSIDYNNPYQLFISEGYGTSNPTAYTYRGTTEFTGTGETYTIVGLYNKDIPWEGDGSFQDFRVNTVFVPKTSVTGEMDHGELGLFLAVVLYNGKADAFETVALRDRYARLFSITDQNYASIQDKFYNYSDIAQNALIIGGAVYLMLLVLFLIFYPAMQRMTLTVMAKVGGSRAEMLGYMMVSCLGILIPGTVAGIALSAALWDRVIGVLLEAAWTTLELEFDIVTMLVIAGLQLAAASLLVFLVSLGMTLNKNLMNRQKFRLSIPGLKRLPKATAGAMAFALVISLVLCTLSASNKAEYASYETAVQTAEVRVELRLPGVDNAFFLLAPDYVKELIYENRFSFSLRKYLVDEAYMNYMNCDSINAEVYDETIWGMTAHAEPENLSSKWNAKISWLPGYDASAMDSQTDMYLLVPEDMSFADADADMNGTQVVLGFIRSWNGAEYSCMATVAGTYTNDINSTTIYCSIEPLFYCGRQIGAEPYLQHFSATVKSNDVIDELRKEANRYFVDPEATEEQTDWKFMTDYILYIYDDVLDRLAVTLENSIQFNELCTMLIFVFSAGTGFILGFLMIRSRKREIILMRTLGKPNLSIYFEYALEQMLCIVAGTAIGGLTFQWQPVERLGIFVGIYFVGLSAALILFLNSKLLTTIKEDE